jgi:signal peptidase I
MIHWFLSKTVREACALRNHVRRLVNAQRDLMTPSALQLVQGALVEFQGAIKAQGNKSDLRKEMVKLEQVAGKWLKPYPNPVWRENVEVLLVAIAVAMGIRTFFLQPFKIPTGSMQPTLYGVTSMPDFTPIYNQIRQGATDQSKIQSELSDDLNSVNIPGGWQRFIDWFHGKSYVHVVAQNDGELQAVNPPVRFLIFNLKQTLVIGGVEHTIWFPPDYGEQTLVARAALFPRNDLYPGRTYRKGEDVVKLQVNAGDHLFVDRLTYNFRKPNRGEIVVFETRGIPEADREMYHVRPDDFYIKRLVGLGGETISLKQDYEVTGVPQFDGEKIPIGHLVVDGNPLSAATPHFENLYSFSEAHAGAKVLQYKDNKYYGHAMIKDLSPGQQFQIRTNYLFVMGDNTLNSLDSRFWGDFPASAVIGKSFFVYWPLTRRFGVGHSIAAQ